MRPRMHVKALIVVVVGALVFAAPAVADKDEDEQKTIAIEVEKFYAELEKAAAKIAEGSDVERTGELTARSASCDEQVEEQRFLQFGDRATYTAVPGGTFETSATGWTLTNEARIVSSGNARPGNALSLPKGSSVTTRPLCVTAAHPTLRMFATATSSAARLRVEVLYEDLGGSVKVLPIGWLQAGQDWAPTEIVKIHASRRAELASARTAAVAFRLTAEEDGVWSIDELYVDPFKFR